MNKKRKLTIVEKKHIDYLQARKNELLDNFIGACQEINNQISEVENGTWMRSVSGGLIDEKSE